MARPLRIEFPGAVYHVTARGNERKPISRDDRDRERFLEILAEAADRFRGIRRVGTLVAIGADSSCCAPFATNVPPAGPRHIFFCTESDLPVLGSGKVDKQALRNLAALRSQS